MPMNSLRLLCAVVLAGLMPGCSLFGYYKYERAPYGPIEKFEDIRFPDSFESGTHLEGPTFAAFLVAINEFIPPHSKADTGNKALTECMSRRDTYDVSILKANDDLYFINFFPKIERCGIQLDVPLIDVGATFAIDRTGRVLSVL
jgi:hypothetical protein